MSPSAVRDPGYRADIDGLRAVAVVLVIAFHLAPAAVPGGFVGVDVFFVISGFVVTQATLRHETGRALSDFLGFWRRRIARIYPALVLCIAATMLAVALLTPIFPPVVYNAFNRTGLAALFGLSNVYLDRQSTNYFLQDQGSANPFIHTWSLGVEEQFYLFFAVFFMLVGVLLIGGGRRRSLLRAVLFSAASLVSLVLFLRSPDGAQSQGYFLPQYRLWQLGIGSLLGLAAWHGFLRRPASEPFRFVARVAAVATMVFPPFFLGADDSHSIIVLATLSAAVILATPAADSIGSVLSWRLVRGIGLRSYSLYLWHWPVIVFFAFTVGIQTVSTVAAALLVTTALAMASYRFVEMPLRRPGRFWTRVMPTATAGAVLTLALGAVAETRPGVLFVGGDQAWADEWLPDYGAAYAGTVRASECNISGFPVAEPTPDTCVVRSTLPAERLVFSIGDSQAFANWGMLEQGWREGAFGWAAYSHDGCDVVAYMTEPAATSCGAYWATMPSRVSATVAAGDVLFIALRWHPEQVANTLEALRPVVAAARSAGADIVIQAPLPAFDRDAFNCTNEWFRLDYAGCDSSRNQYDEVWAETRAALAIFAREEDIRVWDPVDLLCDAGRCSQFRGDVPLYRDRHHLSYVGSRSLWPAFAEFLATARPI